MLLTLALTLLAQQAPWHVGGGASSPYRMVTATGSVLDSAGALLVLRTDSSPGSAYGTIVASMSATDYRGRLAILSADVESEGVTGGASIWLRVDGQSGAIALDNGMATALKGNASGHREARMFVPPEASELVFGLLLTGSGQATIRGLRLTSLSLPPAGAAMSPAARELLDSAFVLVRTNALWRDSVNWDQVEPRIRAQAAFAESTADVYPAIRALLGSLGDHHSFLLEPAATTQFRSGGIENAPPQVRTLERAIGHIAIPAYSGIDSSAAHAFVVNAYAALGKASSRESCRWVVDLRENGGGNMWPMLSTLRPFLGDTLLGGFATHEGRQTSWHAKDGVDVTVPRALRKLESAYVAVLTGPRTASSGEAVTIAFIGRPRTRSFGLPTAGRSTANATLPLPDGSMLMLTVSVQADRNGRSYGKKVPPDETVAADSTGGDAALAHAIAWLRAQPACSR